MGGNTTRRKYRTKFAYGKRKRKPVQPAKRRRLSAPHVHESRDSSAEEQAAISPRDLPQTALASDDERVNLGQSTSHGAAGDFQHDSAVERLISPEATVHQRSPARSPRRYRRQQGSRSPRRHRPEQGARSQKSAEARFPETRCSVPLPNSDLSDSEVRDAALSLPSTSSGIAAPQQPQFRSGSAVSEFSTPSTSRTIQAHIEPAYASAEAAEAQASSIRASLREVSATERKLSFTKSQEELPESSDDHFLLVQASALNSMVEHALCPVCMEKGLFVQHGAEFGLATKMELSCRSCGTKLHSQWSSGRIEGAKTFEVNIRSMQAMKGIGKGATALNDFWSTMNVSKRGLHHKTYQKHLKNIFKPAAEAAARSIFDCAVEAVKKVYAEMEVTLSKNITVVYDGTWLTRGHASHIGVGCVIEFYTGLVLDCAVLSNFCLGCSLGPKETDPKYNEWKRTHQCQKKNRCCRWAHGS